MPPGKITTYQEFEEEQRRKRLEAIRRQPIRSLNNVEGPVRQPATAPVRPTTILPTQPARPVATAPAPQRGYDPRFDDPTYGMPESARPAPSVAPAPLAWRAPDPNPSAISALLNRPSTITPPYQPPSPPPLGQPTNRTPTPARSFVPDAAWRPINQQPAATPNNRWQPTLPPVSRETPPVRPPVMPPPLTLDDLSRPARPSVAMQSTSPTSPTLLSPTPTASHQPMNQPYPLSSNPAIALYQDRARQYRQDFQENEDTGPTYALKQAGNILQLPFNLLGTTPLPVSGDSPVGRAIGLEPDALGQMPAGQVVMPALRTLFAAGQAQPAPPTQWQPTNGSLYAPSFAPFNPARILANAQQYVVEEWAKQNALNQAINALPTDQANAARIVTNFSASGSQAQQAGFDLIRQKQQLPQLYAQAQQLAAAGNQQAASAAYLYANSLRAQTYTDLAESQSSPLAEFTANIFLDPLNLLDAPIGILLDAQRAARTAGAIRALEGFAPSSLDDALIQGQRMLGMVQAGQPVTPPRNWLQQLVGRTPETQAHFASDALLQSAAQLYRNVENAADARIITDAWLNNPKSLVTGVRGLTSPGFQAGLDANGIYRFGAGAVAMPNQVKAMPILSLIRDDLLTAPALTDASFSPLEWLRTVDNAIYRGARQAAGLVPLEELPFGATRAAIINKAPQRYSVDFFDANNQLLGSSKLMPLNAAKTYKKNLDAALKAGQGSPIMRGLHGAANVQRTLLSDMWLNLRPTHWIRNATTANLALNADGIHSLRPLTDIVEDLNKKFAFGAPTTRIAGAIGPEAAPALADDQAHITRRVWDRGNPLAFLSEKANKLWTGTTQLPGGIPFGEDAAYMKGFDRAFNRTFRQAWTGAVNNALNPLYQTLGLSPDVAAQITNRIISAGIDGSRSDMQIAARNAVNGKYLPFDLRNFNIPDELVSAEGKRQIHQVINDWYNSGPTPANLLPEVETAIRTTFAGERTRYADMLLDAPPQAGNYEWTKQDILDTGAEIIDQMTEAARASGANVDAAEQAGRQLAQQVTDAEIKAVEQFLDEVKLTPTHPDAMNVSFDLLARLHKLKQETRREVDALSRLAADAKGANRGPAWQRKFQETGRLYTQYAADVQSEIAKSLADLRTVLAGGQVERRYDWWSALDRYFKFDEEANRIARSTPLGSTTSTPRDVWDSTIDANRQYVDASFVQLYDAFRRYPSMDAMDVLRWAHNNVDDYGARAAAYLAPLRQKALDNAISWDKYFATRNQVWTQLFDNQVIVNDLAKRAIVSSGITEGTPNVLRWEDPFAGSIYQLIGPGKTDAAGNVITWKAYDVQRGKIEEFANQTGAGSALPDVPKNIVDSYYRITEQTARIKPALDEIAAANPLPPRPAPNPQSAIPAPQSAPPVGAIPNRTAPPTAPQSAPPVGAIPNRTAPPAANGLPSTQPATWNGIQSLFGERMRVKLWTDTNGSLHIVNQYGYHQIVDPKSAPWSTLEITTPSPRPAPVRQPYETPTVTPIDRPSTGFDDIPTQPYGPQPAPPAQTDPADLLDYAYEPPFAGATGPVKTPYTGSVADEIDFNATPVNARSFAIQMQQAYRLDPAQTQAVAALAEARANIWAKQTGRSAADWYTERLAEIAPGNANAIDDQALLQYQSPWRDYAIAKNQQDAIAMARKVSPDPRIVRVIHLPSSDSWAVQITRFATDKDPMGFSPMGMPGSLHGQSTPVSYPVDRTSAMKSRRMYFGRNGTMSQEWDPITNEWVIRHRVPQEQIYKIADVTSTTQTIKPPEGVDPGWQIMARSSDRRTALQQAAARIDELGLPKAFQQDIYELLQKTGETAKGSATFLDDQRAILRGFQSADVSTAAHEMAHVFRRDLADVAKINPQAALDMRTAEKWAGAVDGNWTREAEEKFARGFETYLRTGEAPTDGLRRVFEQFKQWLTTIYRTLKGDQLPNVPDDMRQVYDRLLAETPPTAAPDPNALLTKPSNWVSTQRSPLEVGQRVTTPQGPGTVTNTQKTFYGVKLDSGKTSRFKRSNVQALQTAATPEEITQGQRIAAAAPSPTAPTFGQAPGAPAKPATENMFAATNEDLPLMSGAPTRPQDAGPFRPTEVTAKQETMFDMRPQLGDTGVTQAKPKPNRAAKPARISDRIAELMSEIDDYKQTRIQYRKEWDRVAVGELGLPKLDAVNLTLNRGGFVNTNLNSGDLNDRFADLWGNTIAGIELNNTDDLQRLLTQYADQQRRIDAAAEKVRKYQKFKKMSGPEIVEQIKPQLLADGLSETEIAELAAMPRDTVLDYYESLTEDMEQIGYRYYQTGAPLPPDMQAAMPADWQLPDPKEIWQNLIKYWGKGKQPEVGDVARHMIRTLNDAEDAVIGALPGLAQQPPNALNPAARNAIIDAVDRLGPTFDNVVAVARNAAKDLADGAMLNYSDRRGFDQLLSLVFPYHYYWTRGGLNWAQRLARKPSYLNIIQETNRLQDSRQQQLDTPQRMDSYIPLGRTPDGSVLGIGNPLNWILPRYTPNEFIDPEDARSQAERYWLMIQQSTPGLLPLLAYGADAFFDWQSGAEGKDRKATANLRQFVPAAGIAADAVQAATGKVAPAGVGPGDPWDPYRVRTTLAVMAQEKAIDPATAQYAQQIAFNLETGKDRYAGIPPANKTSADAAYIQASQRSGGQRLLTTASNFFTGSPLTIAPQAEIDLRAQQRDYNAAGYDPLANPYGSNALRREQLDQNPALPTMWTRNATVTNQPAVSAQRSQRWDALTNAVFAPMNQATTAAIRQNPNITPAQLNRVKAPFYDRIAAIDARFPLATGSGSSRPPSGGTPQERALYELKRIIDSAGGPPPTWPGDNATPEQRTAYRQQKDAYDQRKLNAIERNLSQYLRTVESDPSQPWQQELARLVQGQYATDLKRNYDDLAYAEPTEKAWAEEAYFKQAASNAQWQDKAKQVTKRLGTPAAQQWAAYHQADDATRDLMRTDPAVKQALMAGYNPNEYDALIVQFGPQAWETYFDPTYPKHPGDGATQEQLNAYYAQRDSFEASHPRSSELRFWLNGRYRWSDESSTPVEFYDFGKDWQEAQRVFGPDIFKIEQQANSAPDYGTWARNHQQQADLLTGYRQWKSALSDTPTSTRQLPTVNLAATPTRQQATSSQPFRSTYTGPDPYAAMTPISADPTARPLNTPPYIPPTPPTVGAILNRTASPTDTTAPAALPAVGAILNRTASPVEAPAWRPATAVPQSALYTPQSPLPGPSAAPLDGPVIDPYTTMTAQQWANRDPKYAQRQARLGFVQQSFGDAGLQQFQEYANLPADSPQREEYRRLHPEISLINMAAYDGANYSNLVEQFGQDALLIWANTPAWGESEEAQTIRRDYLSANPQAWLVDSYVDGRPRPYDPTAPQTERNFGADWAAAEQQFGADIMQRAAAYRAADSGARRAMRDADPTLMPFFDWWYAALPDNGSGGGPVATYRSADGLVTYDQYGRRLDSVGNVARGFYPSSSGGGGGGSSWRSYPPEVRSRYMDERLWYASDLRAWRPPDTDINFNWLNSGSRIGPDRIVPWRAP